MRPPDGASRGLLALAEARMSSGPHAVGAFLLSCGRRSPTARPVGFASSRAKVAKEEEEEKEEEKES